MQTINRNARSKTVLPFLLALILLFSAAPISAQTTSQEGFSASLDDIFFHGDDFLGTPISIQYENYVLFGDWAYYTSKDTHFYPWKMVIYAKPDLKDYKKVSSVVLPYLTENDIKHQCLGPLPKGAKGDAVKPILIYPKSQKQMEKIARDLDRIIRQNNLTIKSRGILADCKNMGQTGRLFYRYEYLSGIWADVNLDFNYSKTLYNYLYQPQRAGFSYLASDMQAQDDIWKNFNPADISSKPTSVSYKKVITSQEQLKEALKYLDEGEELVIGRYFDWSPKPAVQSNGAVNYKQILITQEKNDILDIKNLGDNTVTVRSGDVKKILTKNGSVKTSEEFSIILPNGQKVENTYFDFAARLKEAMARTSRIKTFIEKLRFKFAAEKTFREAKIASSVVDNAASRSIPNIGKSAAGKVLTYAAGPIIAIAMTAAFTQDQCTQARACTAQDIRKDIYELTNKDSEPMKKVKYFSNPAYAEYVARLDNLYKDQKELDETILNNPDLAENMYKTVLNTVQEQNKIKKGLSLDDFKESKDYKILSAVKL